MPADDEEDDEDTDEEDEDSDEEDSSEEEESSSYESSDEESEDSEEERERRIEEARVSRPGSIQRRSAVNEGLSSFQAAPTCSTGILSLSSFVTKNEMGHYNC
jgi:hypothetical protein